MSGETSEGQHDERKQTDPVFIPFDVASKALRDSDGELCWKYMGLGRGWHAWFNSETGYYNIAISANVPEPTEDGVTVHVEVQQHWFMSEMEFKEFYPDRWHGRLETVSFNESPFPELDNPNNPPRRVPNGE